MTSPHINNFCGPTANKNNHRKDLKADFVFQYIFPFVKDTIIKTFLTISGTSYLFTRVSGW